MPATSQLSLYNGALFDIGSRKLTSLSEEGESRRALDEVYDKVVEDCLLDGSWNFAMETIKATADTGVEPEFGPSEVFAKPADWLRTHSISGDENFSAPLLHYVDDVNYWSADINPIYVRYISNDTGAGLELNNWPRNFSRYVELALASRICMRLTQSKTLTESVKTMCKEARLKARNTDAMNEANPKFPPSGSWTASRGGNRSSNRSRGNPRQLIG